MQTHNINLNSKVEGHLFHLAIGNFDGIHLGHQQIINSLVKVAKELNRPSAILSFNPHPRQFFSRELDQYQILSEEKKQLIFTELGIDHYFCLKFDELLSNLSPVDFIKKIIVDQLKVEKLIVGYDFQFGKDRKGDTNLLLDHGKIHGFNLEIISPDKTLLKLDVNQVVIPSFEGSMTILKDHISLVTFLRPGFIEVDSEGKADKFFAEEGTVEFSKNRLLIGETLNNTTNLRGELEANVGGNSTSNMNTSQTRFKTRSQSKPTNS